MEREKEVCEVACKGLEVSRVLELMKPPGETREELEYKSSVDSLARILKGYFGQILDIID